MTRLSALISLCLLAACAKPEPAPSSDEPTSQTPSVEARCKAAAACGVDATETCPDGTGCHVLDACGGPVCVSGRDACQIACGTDECAIMESFPMQVGCS